MATANPGTAGPHATPIPTDPYLTDAERERLTPQCSRILALLRQRPQWNYDLATRRISDIRAAGYEVDIIATVDNGARLYGLVVNCPACSGTGRHWSGGSCYDCNSKGQRLVAATSNSPEPGCDLSPIAWGDMASYSPIPSDGVLAGGRVD